MTDHEDRFAASLDALSRGEPPVPNDELARFVTDAKSIWPNPTDGPPGSPPRLSTADRRHLWTDIQQQAAVKSSATHEGSNFMSVTSPNVPARTHPPTGWGATIARWQPIFSMAVMFAILAGLVGIAYTGLNRQENGPEPTTLAALQDDATPAPALTCVDYGPPVRSSSELRDMSLTDWPARAYGAVAPANPEVAQQAVDVYENWLSCAAEYSNDTSVSPPPEGLIRFWSDRMQYQFMLERNPSFRPEERIALDAETRIDAIMQSGTLPLNRPIQETEFSVAGEFHQTFVPGDVYELADGRFGVVIGAITSEQLTSAGANQTEVEGGIWLAFIAFMPNHDYLLIDEFLAFCVVPPVLPFNGTVDIAACAQTSNGIDG